MDLDCTFYFWKRKLFSAVMGVAFAGAVFGSCLVMTDNSLGMCVAYGLLVGIFAGTSTNVLISESFCADNQCLDWGSESGGRSSVTF